MSDGRVRLDELSEGDECSWQLPTVTRSHFVRYAGASGDFNPIHHDDDLARAAGFPSVFAPGMLMAGALATYLTNWFGPGSLRKYRVRFTGQVWPNDSLCFRAVVRRKNDAARTVALELSVANHDGRTVLRGNAVASVGPGG